MIKIELAEINDLDDIMKMIHKCANDLISKNIFQWRLGIHPLLILGGIISIGIIGFF